jgi:aspartate 1-decarboxylase
MEEAEARAHAPQVVLVDGRNRVAAGGAVEVAGPARRVTA